MPAAATSRCASSRRCRPRRACSSSINWSPRLARETLWVTDAYFVGVSAYIHALIAAAQDGVDVRLLVPGTVDVFGVGSMSRAGYRALLEGGVRIFEWNGVDGSRQDRGGRRPVGARRLDQPQHHELVRQLGARRRDRGSTTSAPQMQAMFERDLAEFHRGRAEARAAGCSRSTGERRAAPPPRLEDWRTRGRSTRRAAAAGAIRMGRTLGAAITAAAKWAPPKPINLFWSSLIFLGSGRCWRSSSQGDRDAASVS